MSANTAFACALALSLANAVTGVAVMTGWVRVQVLSTCLVFAVSLVLLELVKKGEG